MNNKVKQVMNVSKRDYFYIMCQVKILLLMQMR